MIQLVTAENEAQFLALANQPSVTACKIHTLYQCYRDDPTMAQFWIFSRGERPMGILSLCSKVLTIWAPYLLAPEFAEFLNFIGWELVECDSTGIFSVANLLGAPVENCSVQRFDRLPQESLQRREIPAIQDELSIRELYELLCQTDEKFKDVSVLDAWMCSISHRVRHGFSKVYGILEGEALVSTAGIYTESASCGVIESVATHPQYRGRGYASALVLQCVQTLASAGKSALLVTSQLRTHEMYHRLGFRDSGTLFFMRPFDEAKR